MTAEDLHKLHQVQLSMMDDVHSFCVEHNIRYYLIAGSALGAVRHGGFIPWDVDIDIAMPRSDYQRFLEQYSSLFNPRYDVLYYKNKKNINCPHALISLKGSRVEFVSGFERYGIYIDLFPLDACPDDSRLREKQMSQLQRIRQILYKKKGRKGNNFLFTLCHKLVSWALLPITVDRLNKIRDKVMTKYQSTENTAECWCSMASKYKYTKQCMPKEYYGTPKLINFEGRQYFAPERIEDHLKHLYGDYMILPPVESRKSLMDYIIYASWKDIDGKLVELKSK